MLYVNPVSPALNRIEAGSPAAEEARKKTAMQELEHLFLYTLLREMRQTVSVNGEKKGRELELYEEMLDDALSSEMAKSGQVGMARQLEQELAARLPRASVQTGVCR